MFRLYFTGEEYIPTMCDPLLGVRTTDETVGVVDAKTKKIANEQLIFNKADAKKDGEEFFVEIDDLTAWKVIGTLPKEFKLVMVPKK